MSGEGASDGHAAPTGAERSGAVGQPAAAGSRPPPDRYLVYGDDGAVLVYSGGDQDRYQDARRTLDATHAGALAGQSMMGRERWLIVTYYRRQPDDAFIRRRREGGLLGLAWQPSTRDE